MVKIIIKGFIKIVFFITLADLLLASL